MQHGARWRLFSEPFPSLCLALFTCAGQFCVSCCWLSFRIFFFTVWKGGQFFVLSLSLKQTTNIRFLHRKPSQCVFFFHLYLLGVSSNDFELILYLDPLQRALLNLYLRFKASSCEHFLFFSPSKVRYSFLVFIAVHETLWRKCRVLSRASDVLRRAMFCVGFVFH